jgi:hypothetical protein
MDFFSAEAEFLASRGLFCNLLKREDEPGDFYMVMTTFPRACPVSR